MITTEKAEKSREKQRIDDMDGMDRMDGAARQGRVPTGKSEQIEVMAGDLSYKLVFSRDKIRNYRKKGEDNPIIASYTARMESHFTMSQSYFADGSLMIAMYRYDPVYTHLSISLRRPSHDGKIKAIAYALKALSEVLQYDDVNEELDI